MRQRQPIFMVIAIVLGVAVTIAAPQASGPGAQAGQSAPVALEPGGPVRPALVFMPIIVKSGHPAAVPAPSSRSPWDTLRLLLPSIVQGVTPTISSPSDSNPPTPTPGPKSITVESSVTCNRKGVVTARDGKFWLNAREFKFTGVNANFLMAVGDKEVERALRYLSTGCGTSVVRVFVSDWGPGPDSKTVQDEARNDARQVEKIRSILKIGRGLNLKFIIVLDNTLGHMWGDQFVGSKSTAWYDHEYKGEFPGGSYRRHVERVVRALKDDFRDEIFAWELLNEPGCEYPITKLGGRPDGDYDEKCPPALLRFVQDMSALIKRLDPVHMVTLGTAGDDQYGVSPTRRNRYVTDKGEEYWDFGYRVIHEVPTVDALVAHYYGEYQPGSQDSVLGSAISIARALNKPFFIEEHGANVPGCPRYQCPRGCEGDYERQAGIIRDFTGAMFDAGVKGVLLWEFSVYPVCNEFSFYEGGWVCDLLERHSEKLCQSR